jgi:hypothetical protein
MAAKDDFEILKDAVKNGLQSVTLPDGRTFTLDQARTERDRLEKELKKKRTVTETEESIKVQQIKDAEKIVKNRESLLTQTLRAFGKNNASATDVANAQEALRTSSEFLSRLTSQTVVTATSTAAKPGYTTDQVANLLSSTPVVPPTEVVTGEPPAPTSGENGVKKTVVITKGEVDAKLAELKLSDTPENRKTARQALKTGTTVAPAVADTSWEPIFKENYPQYNWMFTDLDRTKYADVFTLFSKAIDPKTGKQIMTDAEFDKRYIGTSFYRELETSKKGRELSAAIGNFSWNSGNLAKFLTKAMQFGYTGDNLKQQAYAELFKKVDNKYVNDLALDGVRASTPYLAIKNIGTQYFSPFADSKIEQALSGVVSTDDLVRQARLAAKATYGHLSEQIDAGLTLEDLSASYKEKAAKLLELDPNTINFATDFSDALNYRKDGQPRVLSMSEWETELRTNDKYKYSFTKQANQDATSIGLAIARAFGKVQ